jgi:predicted amidohydrolase YtcJ
MSSFKLTNYRYFLFFLLTLAWSQPGFSKTLIKNIKGYSFEAVEPGTFTAVAIDGDKVHGIFDENPDEENFAKIIDGKGATLLPGLIDAHGHVYRYGEALDRVILNGASSKKVALERVEQFIASHPDDKWITGGGWNQELWPDRKFPDADALSSVSGDKSVVLLRIDGHAIWVNKQVLEKAGINKDTKSPEGGEIVKDANGEPTGILVDNAMNLVFELMPKPTLEDVKDTIELSLNTLASLGLTSVHDAGVDHVMWQAYQELSQENRLPIRVYVMLDVTDPKYPQMLQKGIIRSDDDKLFVRSVKISSDGALGSRGAALHEEYSDKPGHFGLLLHEIPELNALTLEAMKAGFQVNTHAIGDKANTVSLDAFAKAIQVTKSGVLRHRIEHAQVIHPDDFSRFQQLNVIASVQPTHATSDKNMAENRIGSERIKGAYAWSRLMDNEALLAGGSDFPIEPAEPLFGIHAAVTRQDRNNQPEGGWYKNEGVTLSQAFHMFTLGAAYSAHQDDIIGSIEPGKKADFVLIAEDPFYTQPEKLWQIQVLETWVNGKPVFTQ